MKQSIDRILTTHVGSLPRPQPLVEVLVKKDQGEPYDAALFARLTREAVQQIVARQVAVGIDVVSDGEASKIGYATYIKERLTGFGGEPFAAKPQRDLAAHPAFRERMTQFIGPQVFRRLCCNGPVALSDREAVKEDVANLKAAAALARPIDVFMPAASPGLISAFQPNRHYASHLAYLEAVAEAMREEYAAIAAAGIVVQLDSPDLAMARHTGMQDQSESEFLERVEQHVEAMNHALAGVPASAARIHLCWGNYEGPHDFDIPLAKILPVILKAKPQAIAFEAANPRHAHEWTLWREVKLPEDKILIPGVIDTCTNYVEHPELVAQRICQFADCVGRERVIAGTDCGFATYVGRANRVDPDIAYKKLASLAEGAKLASARLWR